MKRSRFAQEQIIGVLEEHQASATAPDLCRKHGVSIRTLALATPYQQTTQMDVYCTVQQRLTLLIPFASATVILPAFKGEPHAPRIYCHLVASSTLTGIGTITMHGATRRAGR